MKTADRWSVCKHFREDDDYGIGFCTKWKEGIANGYQAAYLCGGCPFFEKKNRAST